MKTVSLFAVLVMFSTLSYARPYEAGASGNLNNEDSTSSHVEGKIEDALNEALDHQDFARLSVLEEEINSASGSDATYWKAYLAFQEAVYFLENEEEEESNKFVQKGIRIVEDIKTLSSEDYALLAMMQGFSIQLADFTKAPALAERMKNNAIKAIELDAKNPRGYYVYAIQNYYTPEEYGGGSEVEEYLEKAVAILKSSNEPTKGPNWGEDSSFELLINYYLRKDQHEAAKKLYQEAIAIYPDSYIVDNLKRNF